jgi:protein TonB
MEGFIRIGQLKAMAGLLLVGNLTYAQGTVVTATPVPRIEYFDAQDKPVTKENASYSVKTVYRDSIGGVITTFYPSGKPKQIVPYAHIASKIRHGVATTWFESGQMKTKESFFANKRTEFITYYPTGVLRRKELYSESGMTSGACFSPDGQPLPYSEYLVSAQYPGGHEAMVRDLRKYFRVPAAAKKADLHGRLFIQFVVDKQGKVRNPKITKGLSPEVDQEALRVVRLLTGWTPTKIDNEVEDTSYTLPFSI